MTIKINKFIPCNDYISWKVSGYGVIGWTEYREVPVDIDLFSIYSKTIYDKTLILIR
jgi:hypothetical protein